LPGRPLPREARWPGEDAAGSEGEAGGDGWLGEDVAASSEAEAAVRGML